MFCWASLCGEQKARSSQNPCVEVRFANCLAKKRQFRGPPVSEALWVLVAPWGSSPRKQTHAPSAAGLKPKMLCKQVFRKCAAKSFGQKSLTCTDLEPSSDFHWGVWTCLGTSVVVTTVEGGAPGIEGDGARDATEPPPCSGHPHGERPAPKVSSAERERPCIDYLGKY